MTLLSMLWMLRDPALLEYNLELEQTVLSHGAMQKLGRETSLWRPYFGYVDNIINYYDK